MLAVVTVVGLLGSLAGCATALPPVGGLLMIACSEAGVETAAVDASGGERSIECGLLTVPLEHSDPGASSLEIVVARVPATDPERRIGSLIINPGGPGLSGIDGLTAWVSWFPEELLARFDLVTFDPRGTGRSGPIDCEPAPEGEQLPDLTTDDGWQAAQELMREQAAACTDPLGDSAGAYSTDAMARDLELLRVAVGDEQLTYLGWSYGARLGAHYARLFPDRVRALVLDGPPAATVSRAAVTETQIAGFESSFAAYALGCAERETCTPIGDPAALFARVIETARSEPIPSGRPAGDPPATWDVVERAALGFLASPDLWPYLDDALAEADRGDSGALYDMIDSLEGRDSAESQSEAGDAAFVIGCNDSEANELSEETRVVVADLAARFPVFGEYGAWWLLGCAYWEVDHTALPTTPVNVANPIMVIATTGDPSTPYVGAEDFVRSLGADASLVTWTGIGHTAFGRSSCVAELVVSYLTELQSPPLPAACD